MTTTNKYQIETRTQTTAGWTTEGMGAHNEFETAAEARRVVRVVRGMGASWAAAEYRLRGPDGVESAEMDGPAWKLAIDLQLKRLGLSDESNGRSVLVCNMADNGIEVALSDHAADWCVDADAEDVLAILEAIDADQSQEDIRAELASELDAL